MVEVHRPELEGERVRYRNDTWELTGTIDVRRNGDVVHTGARKADRVRGNAGRLSFTLADPPSSLNPGNLGEFQCDLQQGNEGAVLVINRDHTTDRYRLDSVSYD